MRTVIACIAAVAGLAVASPALASFPYVGAGQPGDPTTWHVAPGQDLTNHTGAPNEIGCGTWKMAATPEHPTTCPDDQSPSQATAQAQDAAVQNDPHELGGVRGDSTADVTPGVNTAWNVTTGRPDVTIAVLDSGIEWNSKDAMTDLRAKVRLNKGELPVPEVSGPSLTGVDCSTYHVPPGQHDYDPNGDYDVNGDGVFNTLDYACDPRVKLDDPRRAGPPGFLTPEDVIIAFTDGQDHDHNGFANDIAGWDFVDNDNDPYDDVQYGHGTGEARDSNAEADNGGDVGTCPNCTVVPLRVGESFIADVNRFAEAVLYASDNGASIVQEALGTLNNSTLARNAIDYAYYHGVTVVASAADEAAQHHNQPGVLPHTILVNSVNKYNETFTPQPRSYLQFNGCTNFMTKVTVSVPSSSCSSEATGRSSGIVGLIYSAALNYQHTHPSAVNNDCHRVAGGTNGANGQPCVITPNEVRQLLQGAADDVNFADSESSCPAPKCTDPNLNAPSSRTDVAPVANTKPYPARKGYDEFYGYGRLNAYRSVAAAANGKVPPEASIESPDWWAQIDPAQPTIDVKGRVDARGSAYTCAVYVAPGSEPNNGSDVSAGGYGVESSLGDFKQVSGGFCDGATQHTGPSANEQVLGSIDTATLKGLYPPEQQAYGFNGAEPGPSGQSSNGRPNSEPYGFTVKVVVQTVGATPLRGEDRRNLYLHRDQDMLNGWPKVLTSDGAASPLLVDLDGDNRNELIVATSDGLIHAYRRDGSELPGWPVHGDGLPLHTGEPAFASGAVPQGGSAFLASPAAADINGDGAPEIIDADLDGRVYAWDASGHRVFTQEANPAWSGKPLQPFVNVRNGPGDRTEHGFVASPVVADLDGDGKPEIIEAGEDRHLYAWHADGTPVAGFPILVVDPRKVKSVDPTTNAVTFDPAKVPDVLDQGKIVDTPAVGDIDGDGKPEIVLGTNEEYRVNSGNEGALNVGTQNAASIKALENIPGSPLSFANSRLYAFRATGDPDGVSTPAGGLMAGWPKPIAIIDAELLPDVGEGMTGSPVLAPIASCDSSGKQQAVGTIPDAGLGYLLKADGTSCLGSDSGGDNTFSTDDSAGTGQQDHPVFAAVGNPAFGNLDVTPGAQPSFLAPVAGLFRALDLLVNDYQVGGQDFSSAWETTKGQFRPGFPARQNDLSFLAGPAVGDIDGNPGEEVVDGTASLDLEAFNGATGVPIPNWPKLTGDWTVSTPAIGSFGTLDTDPSAHKVVVSVTRLGSVQAYGTAAQSCTASSWPRFHHDNANSGDYTRDATAPGRIDGVTVSGRTLSWTAPGDDLMCGTVDHYVVQGANGQTVPGPAGSLATAGATQQYTVPAGAGETVTIWAVDKAGNRGRAVTVNLSSGATTVQGPGATQGASSGGAKGGSGNSSGGRGARRGPSCLNGPFRLREGGRRFGPLRLSAPNRTLDALPTRRHGHGILTVCVRKTPRRYVVGVTRGHIVFIGTRAGVRGPLHPGARRARLHGLRRVRGVVPGLYRDGRTYVVVGPRGRVAYVFVTTIANRRALRTELRRARL